MLEVIKYQLKNRKNSILFLLGVFAVLNLIAWGLETVKILSGDFLKLANPGFWIPVAIMTQAVSVTVMFFACSSGHTRDLLYKDTSYLWLSVPRRGWEILGGRFVAGIVEFAAYAIPVGLFMSVHAAMGAWAAGNMGGGVLSAMAYMYRQVFVVNFVPMVQMTFLALLAFMATGFTLTFAVVASRSFVKNRGAATAVSIAVFVVLSNWATRLGSYVSQRLDWYVPIRISLEGSFGGGPYPGYSPMVNNEIKVPVAALLLLCALGAALFAAASWLMEKKVEV